MYKVETEFGTYDVSIEISTYYYGVKFVFCRPEESGEMIMELLQGKEA